LILKLNKNGAKVLYGKYKPGLFVHLLQLQTKKPEQKLRPLEYFLFRN